MTAAPRSTSRGIKESKETVSKDSLDSAASMGVGA
jgi:hypothetical protein